VLTVVFDAAPLITACKFEAYGRLIIDYLFVAGCRIVIASRVEEEVAVLGASYADGVVAGERIARGAIQVVQVPEQQWARYLAEYAMGQGEKDSIELCGQVEGVEALVTDDYLAFVAATCDTPEAQSLDAPRSHHRTGDARGGIPGGCRDDTGRDASSLSEGCDCP
jgi:hypothetical protein